MDKKKVLFFVTEFWQAGTQRFTYEVDRAIDKNKFEITILSFRNLNTVSDKPDFYYKKHLELGTKVFFYLNLMKKLIYLLKFFQKYYLKKTSLKPF